MVKTMIKTKEETIDMLVRSTPKKLVIKLDKLAEKQKRSRTSQIIFLIQEAVK